MIGLPNEDFRKMFGVQHIECRIFCRYLLFRFPSEDVENDRNDQRSGNFWNGIGQKSLPGVPCFNCGNACRNVTPGIDASPGDDVTLRAQTHMASRFVSGVHQVEDPDMLTKHLMMVSIRPSV